MVTILISATFVRGGLLEGRRLLEGGTYFIVDTQKCSAYLMKYGIRLALPLNALPFVSECCLSRFSNNF